MKMQQVHPRITEPVDLMLPEMERYEKNWSPISAARFVQKERKKERMNEWSTIILWFVIEDKHFSLPSTSDNEYYFSRTVEPHEIVKCSKNGNCKVVAATSAAPVFNALKSALHLKASTRFVFI